VRGSGPARRTPWILLGIGLALFAVAGGPEPSNLPIAGFATAFIAEGVLVSRPATARWLARRGGAVFAGLFAAMLVAAALGRLALLFGAGLFTGWAIATGVAYVVDPGWRRRVMEIAREPGAPAGPVF
jgi:hypothetical protein